MEATVDRGRTHAVCTETQGREGMSSLCREFGISRVIGYKIYERYKECGLEGLTDRARIPTQANKLPAKPEAMIVTLRREKPTWGARKLRKRLLRKLPNDVRAPACSTIHAIMDCHGTASWPRASPLPAWFSGPLESALKLHSQFDAKNSSAEPDKSMLVLRFPIRIRATAPISFFFFLCACLSNSLGAAICGSRRGSWPSNGASTTTRSGPHSVLGYTACPGSVAPWKQTSLHGPWL
jgi:hypothetical protein